MIGPPPSRWAYVVVSFSFFTNTKKKINKYNYVWRSIFSFTRSLITFPWIKAIMEHAVPKEDARWLGLMDLFLSISADNKREIYNVIGLATPGVPSSNFEIQMAVWKDIFCCGMKYFASTSPLFILQRIAREWECSTSKRKVGLIGDIVEDFRELLEGNRHIQMTYGFLKARIASLERTTLYLICNSLDIDFRPMLDVLKSADEISEIILERGFETFLMSLPLRLLRCICEDGLCSSIKWPGNKMVLAHAFMHSMMPEEAKTALRQTRGQKRSDRPGDTKSEKDEEVKRGRKLPASFNEPVFSPDMEEMVEEAWEESEEIGETYTDSFGFA
jgi:hypothetical protein